MPQRVILRPATEADARSLWEWRNEESMRLASLHSDPIPFPDHQAWLARAVKNPCMRLLVASNDARLDIGYIRLDILAEERQAEVSVCLDRQQRGRGFGAALIAAACEALWTERPELEMVALVKRTNAASRAAFEAAGFRSAGTRSRDGHVVWDLRRRCARGLTRPQEP